jgi:hypothetical protein
LELEIKIVDQTAFCFERDDDVVVVHSKSQRDMGRGFWGSKKGFVSGDPRDEVENREARKETDEDNGE